MKKENDSKHKSNSKGRFQKWSWQTPECQSWSFDLNSNKTSKEASEGQTRKNMSESVEFAHEEKAEIRQECCQNRVSGSESHLQQDLTTQGCSEMFIMNGLNNFVTAELVESGILCKIWKNILHRL